MKFIQRRFFFCYCRQNNKQCCRCQVKLCLWLAISALNIHVISCDHLLLHLVVSSLCMCFIFLYFYFLNWFILRHGFTTDPLRQKERHLRLSRSERNPLVSPPCRWFWRTGHSLWTADSPSACWAAEQTSHRCSSGVSWSPLCSGETESEGYLHTENRSLCSAIRAGREGVYHRVNSHVVRWMWGHSLCFCRIFVSLQQRETWPT